MSTPDQPDTPPLTRKQLRELRNTGSTPVISAEDAADAKAEETPAPVPAAPLPRAATSAPVAPAPVGDVDLGVNPLTRRQARQQERIRTASVPVITPDIAAEHAPVPAVISEVPERRDEAPEPEASEAPESAPAETEERHDDLETILAPQERDEQVEDEEEPAQVEVNPALGSRLLEGEVPAAALPASFDQLIARSSSATGSVATPNALILSQTPTGAPLVAPVTATGEVLITGTFELPEGLGSVGHLPGTADGKDLDAALIDGELPPASSPTPIAASAAISTVRNSGEEIIRPPAPDKSNRWTIALTITAGVLVLALAGVLVWAFMTGRI